jgi:hypothetical protein
MSAVTMIGISDKGRKLHHSTAKAAQRIDLLSLAAHCHNQTIHVHIIAAASKRP